MTLNSLAVRNNLVLSLLWHLKIFRSTSTQNIFVGLARRKQVSHSRTGRPATYSVMLVATKSTSFWTNLLPQFTQFTSGQTCHLQPKVPWCAMCHLDPSPCRHASLVPGSWWQEVSPGCRRAPAASGTAPVAAGRPWAQASEDKTKQHLCCWYHGNIMVPYGKHKGTSLNVLMLHISLWSIKWLLKI